MLIDEAGCARITDFGLSKVKSVLSTRTAANVLQTPQSVFGTRAFMSPERLLGGRMTFPVDVYAFAMTMYQVCGGALFSEIRQGLISLLLASTIGYD